MYIYFICYIFNYILVQEVISRNESLEIDNQKLNKTLNDYTSSSSASSSPSNESKVSETDLFRYRQTVQVYM